MPVIRVSSRLWNEVTEVAGREGVSLSYALDRIIDEERRKVHELLDQVDELARSKTPKPKRKPKAKANPEPKPEPAEPTPWPWKVTFGGKRSKCGKCEKHIAVEKQAAHERSCPG